MSQDALRGSWATWYENDDVVAGWLPFDDRTQPSHMIALASPRDADIVCDVLKALGAKPR